MKYKNRKKGTFLYFNNTLFIFLDFFYNGVYFNYKTEFEKKFI